MTELLDSRANDQMKLLASKLEQKDIDRNKTTLAELSRYRKLFTQTDFDQVDTEEITSLSNDFFRRFNLYSPIEVLDDDGALLFRIPQLFISMGEISREHKRLVDIFRKDGGSDIPKYQAQGVQCLLAALFKSQDNAAQERGYETFREYMQFLKNEFHKDVSDFHTLKENIDEVVEVPSENSAKSGTGDVGKLGLTWD